MYTNANELPSVLGMKELKDYLGISRAGVYNLMHRADFPTLHICSRLLVTKENFLTWMEQNTNNKGDAATAFQSPFEMYYDNGIRRTIR